MKKLFSLMVLAIMFSQLYAFAEETRNCPAVINIGSFQNENIKGSGYFNKIIQKEFAEVFQKKFGSRAKVFQQAEMAGAIREEGKRQEGLKKTICDPKLYPPSVPMPEICQFSKEAKEKINVSGDFAVTGGLSELGNKMVLNSSLVTVGGWRVISRATDSFTGAATDPGVQNKVKESVRAAAEKFAAEMVKYFFCIENSPKQKEINFDNPEERKVPIESKVTTLSGDAASGVSINFSNRAPCCGDVTEKEVSVAGGSARTVYNMTKKIESDSVHASAFPSGGIKTSDVTDIGSKEGKLCLHLDGINNTIIKVPEAGGTMKWDRKMNGDAELRVNKEAATISGKGTMYDRTETNTKVQEPQASAHGATSGAKFPLVVTGKWLKDGASRLHVVGTPPENFNVDVHVEGAYRQLPALSGKFEMDVDIPYEDGGKKIESKVMTPIPGMTTTYKYEFSLKKCGTP